MLATNSVKSAQANKLKKFTHRLYTLHGEEPLQLQEAADAIRSAARAAGHTQRSLFSVQGARFDWSEILAATTSSASLFGEKQLVEIRIPSGKPGGKEGASALERLASSLDPQGDCAVLIHLPRLDAATKKSAWFTALAKHGVDIPIHPVERAQLPDWIGKRLLEQGQSAAPSDLEFFADCVEGNLLAAHQEIQKLALLYPEGELSHEQLAQALMHVARYDVFELAQAVTANDVARAVCILDGLQAEGIAPVLVHWSLAQEISILQRLVGALSRGENLQSAMKRERLWGKREILLERCAQRLSKASALRLVHSAHVVDGIVKGIPHPSWPANPWAALLELVLLFHRQLS